MSPFLTGEARKQAEKQDHAREEVHPLDWQDEFGPLKYTQFTEFVMHMQAIERASEDPAKEHSLCAKFGYRDISHFRGVRATFLKYWGKPDGARTLRTFVWKEPEFSQALMASMKLEREGEASAALAANPALSAPEEGLTMEQYGWVCARIAGRQVEVPELQRILAQVGVDFPKWERVNKAWAARMTNDATGTLHTLFTQAFTSGSTGGADPSGGTAAAPGPTPSSQAPSAAEPMSLAQYAEIGARMDVWGKQGKDVNAMLFQTYQISAGDLAKVGLYWHERFNADVRLLGDYTRLQHGFEKQYAQPDPDADLVY
jgi:hypothetical protein